MTLWGEGPARRKPRPADPAPVAAEAAGKGWPRDEGRPEVPRSRPDPVAVAAVAIGFLGIVALGIVAAIVAGVLGAAAGQRARAAGRSLELAYLAFLLAAVDGVVWIVLHYLFKLPIEVG